ncbi:MAG TPA: N-acetylmuramoyl-L-alanine amidase [Gemmatimonadales bacterium]|nr:N-acetylmuramoyl-L-alanine amidase [Gemmatimonadales bacterium]
MIRALAILAVLAGHGLDSVPAVVTVTGVNGETRIPVRSDATGAPVMAAPGLMSALAGSAQVTDGWAEVTLGTQSFRFLVGAPLYLFNNQLQPLAAAVSVSHDTLFLPFQFVAEVLPSYLGDRYRYDRRRARLIDSGASGRAPVARAPAPAREISRLPNGLRPGHTVTIDPGHGGVDPGNPGVFFPRGTREKEVTLAVGLLLRDELKRHGVGVQMTRTSDTLIALDDRGAFCTEACDLFVSIHVNSLARRRGYTDIRGFETYFLAEAKTEDAARVAKMENEAVRFEGGGAPADRGVGIDFILKDLQLNEHLRESARAAELVQRTLGTVHTGENRGVKQAGFMVLTTARRPAILVELGYSTNPQDGQFLTTRSSQKAMAAAIADAIVAYLLEYERKTNQPDSGVRQ